jgi:polysaccharide pyruvyl transferase CsaB
MIDKPFDFFQSIDINTLTSISESFPYVILEGARFSRATVSTHVGGLGDLIESGKNGYLVKPRDWKKLGEHLLKLSLDEEKRNAMGQALRQKAEQLFSLDNMRRTQLEIYDSILAAEKRFKKDGKLYDMALLGYYGYKNSGDEAILKATIKAMRDMNRDLTFVVLSKTPKETMMQNGVDSINRFNLFKAVRMLKKSRLFLAGGGSLIQDNTSTRSIIYYLLMLKIAKKCGVKAMLFANGIGPINRKVNRNMAAKVLNTLDAITLRDPVSFDEIKRMGSEARDLCHSDPGILLEPAGNSEVMEMMEREGFPLTSHLLGSLFRKWGDSGFVDGIAQSPTIVQSTSMCPVMLPMQHPRIAPLRSDHSKHEAACSYDSRYLSPELILGFTEGSACLWACSLHSLVVRLQSMRPPSRPGYEPKVEAFISQIGQVSREG